MLKFAINDEFDEGLEFSFRLLEDQLKVGLGVAMSNVKTVFFEKFDYVCSGEMPFARPIDTLEKSHWAKLAHETVLKVEAKFHEVSLDFHL